MQWPGEVPRVLWTDSQSALAIMVNEGGSWRTRHLRQLTLDSDWRVVSATHVGGVHGL